MSATKLWKSEGDLMESQIIHIKDGMELKANLHFAMWMNVADDLSTVKVKDEG